MHANRPTWQRDECPPWCDGDHREQDHEEDHAHRSTRASIAAIARTVARSASDLPVDGAEAVDLEVAVWQRDGSHQTWVYIGSGPSQCIEISVSSARRVMSALSALLGPPAVPPEDR